jgi:GntR family transcriptional regulator
VPDSRAKYVQVADDLRRRIARGEFVIGYPLPTQVELAAEYGTSKETAAAAVRSLEAEGLVHAVRRRGTIVLPSPDRRRRLRRKRVGVDERGYFFDEVAQQWAPVTRPRQWWGLAPTDVAQALEVAPGTEVLVRDRAVGLLSTGHAEQLVTSYLPADVARDARVEETERGSGGVYERLEAAGYGPLEWRETVSSRMPLPVEGRLLAMSLRVPLLRVVRTARTPGGRVVEVNDCRMSSSSYEVSYPLERDPGSPAAES